MCRQKRARSDATSVVHILATAKTACRPTRDEEAAARRILDLCIAPLRAALALAAAVRDGRLHRDWTKWVRYELRLIFYIFSIQ